MWPGGAACRVPLGGAVWSGWAGREDAGGGVRDTIESRSRRSDNAVRWSCTVRSSRLNCRPLAAQIVAQYYTSGAAVNDPYRTRAEQNSIQEALARHIGTCHDRRQALGRCPPPADVSPSHARRQSGRLLLAVTRPLPSHDYHRHGRRRRLPGHVQRPRLRVVRRIDAEQRGWAQRVGGRHGLRHELDAAADLRARHDGLPPPRTARRRQDHLHRHLHLHHAARRRRKRLRRHRHRRQPEDAQRDEHVPRVARRQWHAHRRAQHALPAYVLHPERVDARRAHLQVLQVHSGRRHRRQHLHAVRHRARQVNTAIHPLTIIYRGRLYVTIPLLVQLNAIRMHAWLIIMPARDRSCVGAYVRACKRACVRACARACDNVCESACVQYNGSDISELPRRCALRSQFRRRR